MCPSHRGSIPKELGFVPCVVLQDVSGCLLLVFLKQVEADLGLPEMPDAAAGQAQARALLHAYEQSLELSLDVDPRDRALGDSLVALAADALLAPHVNQLGETACHGGAAGSPALIQAMLQARC
jgi:hypothetical protein